MNTLDIKKMSAEDRLQVMESIWESLLYEKIDIESPEWHKSILEQRKEKIKNSESEFISIEMLKTSKIE